MKKLCFLILILLGVSNMANAFENTNNGMIIRVSEIEVYPEYLEEYLFIFKNTNKVHYIW